MQIVVRNSKANVVITLEVENSDSIADVKAKIQEFEGVFPAQQQLFFNGEQLQDRLARMHYNMQNKSTLYLWVSKQINLHKETTGSKQSFINTLMAFLRIVHSFLSDTLMNIGG